MHPKEQGIYDTYWTTAVNVAWRNSFFDTYIIIIIIRKGRQCKAGREQLTPYQSEDPNPTTPTHRIKEEKGKTVGDKKWASS